MRCLNSPNPKVQKPTKDKDDIRNDNVSFESCARCVQPNKQTLVPKLDLGPFQQLSPLLGTNEHGWFQVTARNAPSRSGRAGPMPPTTALFLVT